MFGRWRRAQPARVSVVVPLYNHARFIAEALSSVLAQGPLVLEVIVLDDGSTDGGAELAERIAASDARVRVERQANAGAHAAINTALSWCKGELLAILNSDDAYLPGRLAALAAALDADAAAGVAASGIEFMDGAGQAIPNPWYEAARQAYHAAGDLGVALMGGNFLMTTSNLLFRRSALEAVGAFAALRYTHDLDWLLRALALGQRIAMVDTVLLRYRMHGNNTINEDHGRVRAEWAMTASAYLTMLWDGVSAPPVDWDKAGAAQDVLRIHQLDRAAGPCMAYLRRNGALPLDRSPLLTDAAFRARVEGWV
jgi:glycosyltransferase involved in cell wall biosynthesis